jgi:hyperosmotically inducible protein
MKLRALPLMTALLLGTALVPLAGCDRDVDAVHAEKDAKGNTTVHVDGEKVDQNFDQAEKKFDQAGEQIKEGAQQAGAQLKEGAEQAGDALQRGADQVEAEVGPMAREVLGDAAVTAKVKANLVADPEVAALHIDVDTIDGRVTLSGKVSTQSEKAEAEKLAARTEGVKQVDNRIQIVGQAPPPGR